jgi:hypothetical protein
MRSALIALSLLAIVFGSRVCEAGMSDAPRDVSAPTASHKTAVTHHRTGGRVHHARRIGGPFASIGGAIGGLFRR